MCTECTQCTLFSHMYNNAMRLYIVVADYSCYIIYNLHYPCSQYYATHSKRFSCVIFAFRMGNNKFFVMLRNSYQKRLCPSKIKLLRVTNVSLCVDSVDSQLTAISEVPHYNQRNTENTHRRTQEDLNLR